MTSLVSIVRGIEVEIAMGEQCLTNILERLDNDIARINERKQQLKDEFAARRRALEELAGIEPAVEHKAEVKLEVPTDAN
jgi:hypothetical protein